MHLREYLSQDGSLSAAEVRKRMNELGADVKDDAQIRQWAATAKPGKPGRLPSPANCMYLERATDGKVTRQAMRPDDYTAIWRELAPRRVRSKSTPEARTA